MESIDRVSMIAIVTAAAVIGVDMMNMMPSVVSSAISGQVAQVVLGVGVVVASYYHLPTAIVLAAVLYVSLNQTEEPVAVVVEEDKEKTKQDDSMLMPLEEANNTGVPGVASMDMAGDNVLPTQDNSAPEETATEEVVQEVREGVDPTMVNAEDLSNVGGFGGVDMADAL